LGDEERPGPAEGAVGAGQRERAVAARLLAGAQDDLEPGAAAAERGDPLRRDHDRRRAALHVARPAAVQPVAVDLAAEGVAGPVAAAERDGVEMPGEAQRGRIAVGARPPGDEAGAVRPAELVAAHLEARGLEAGGEEVRRPRLVARRVDRVRPDELPRELDDAARIHYFGRTCVAMAVAPRRAAGRGRRFVPLTPSAPSPVSDRTNSSWYVRSVSRSRPSSVPTTQPRKPSGMQKTAGLSSASEPSGDGDVEAAPGHTGSLSRMSTADTATPVTIPVTAPAVLKRGQNSASTRAGKFALAAMQNARPTSAETLNPAPPAIASRIASAPTATAAIFAIQTSSRSETSRPLRTTLLHRSCATA